MSETPDHLPPTEKAFAVLSEHFENVVVLASTVTDQGTTVYVMRNVGNALANVALCNNFLDSMDETSTTNLSTEGDYYD